MLFAAWVENSKLSGLSSFFKVQFSGQSGFLGYCNSNFKITIYNTVILVRCVIKFWDRNLYGTSCQNNSVIGNFMKRLCLISMAISRSNKLSNKAEVKI